MSVSLHVHQPNKTDKYDEIVKKNIKLKEKYSEMKASIKKFRQEFIQSIQNDIEINHLSFKQNFYRSLENLIHECEMLRDSVLMASKLELIYDWYKTKMKSLNEIINKKTHSAFFELFPDVLLPKDEVYLAKNFPKEFESDKRSNIEGIVPKDKLKEFRRRKINEKDNEIFKKSIHLEKKNNDFHLSKDFNFGNNFRFSSTQTSWDKSTNYNTKYGITFREKDPHREIRGSSGSYVPLYNLNNLDIQKTLFNDKNKELSEKRYNEEFNSFMNDWALNKGRYIEEVGRKQDIMLLLKNYKENDNFNKEKVGSIENNSLLLKEYHNVKGLNATKIRNVQKDMIDNTFIFDQIKSDSNTKVINIKSLVETDSARTYNLIKEVQNKLDNVPAEIDASLNAHDKVISVIKCVDPSTNVLEFSKKKSSYSNIANPLSFYDMKNKDKVKKKLKMISVNKFNGKMTIPSLKNKITVDHKGANPEKHNMLRQRKTLSSFDFKEVSLLKGDLAKSSVDIPLKILKGGLLAPSLPKSYDRLFLPSRGFGLLSNPFPEVKKGKK